VFPAHEKLFGISSAEKTGALHQDVNRYLSSHPSFADPSGWSGRNGREWAWKRRPRALGLILASSDALALDQVVCDLLGIRRESLPTNRIASEEGLASDGINVIGEKVEEARISRFRLPEMSDLGWHLPKFLKRALKNALTARPVVKEEVCKLCGQCEEICPARALDAKGGSSR